MKNTSFSFSVVIDVLFVVLLTSQHRLVNATEKKNARNQRQHQRVLQQSQHTTTSPTFQIEQGDIQVIVGYDDDECDESKCVSSGLNDLFNNSFTCYTDDDNYPSMCADGYQPQIIENEATVSHNGNLYHYFTCCPPNPSFDTNTSRHCSNSTTFPGLNKNTTICENTNRPQLRPMKNYTKSLNDELRESYVCCDSKVNMNENQTTNFMNDIECVPYQNKNYEPIPPRNKYGVIYARKCHNPEIGFQFINKHGKCCKSKQKIRHFIQDTAFKKTVYPMIFLSATAVSCCAISIVALLIPLWIHLRKQAACVTGSTNRATNRRLKQAAAASTYSSYNLYLVYLSIPDCIFNLYLLGMYGSYADQKFNSRFTGSIIIPVDYDFISSSERGYNLFESALMLAYFTSNLYLNCFISYEILILLRNCNRLVTYTPPSLLRVTLQAMGVYLFSIIVFIIHYFIGKQAIKAGIDGDYDKYGWLANANFWWSLGISFLCPIGFFFSIWITIKCRDYMPSVTGKMKQLVWFFFRIVFIFCFIWIPEICMSVFGSSLSKGSLLQIGLLFYGLQPIVSTCMTMTNAYVRKYTIKLVTLSYIRSSELETEEEEGEVAA